MLTITPMPGLLLILGRQMFFHIILLFLVFASADQKLVGQRFTIGLGTMPMGYQSFEADLSKGAILEATLLSNQIRIPDQALNRWFYPDLRPNINVTLGFLFLPPNLSVLFHKGRWYLQTDLFTVFTQNRVGLFIDEENDLNGQITTYPVDWYTNHFVFYSKLGVGYNFWIQNQIKVSFAFGAGIHSSLGYPSSTWRDPDVDGNLTLDYDRGRVENYFDYLELSEIFESYRAHYLLMQGAFNIHMGSGSVLSLTAERSVTPIGDQSGNSPYRSYWGAHAHLMVYFLRSTKKRRYY